MQFQRLRVQNWRCFEDETVRFEDGVTVLYGANGAGKTSLLEAAFFALYGTDALETGTTMDDVVTTDEDTATVTLSFAHRGEAYEVTREIRIRASTSQYAEITTPPGKPDLETISEIDSLIESELRLNAEDFLNSAYVRQGDVTRLIEATPDERQRIIDNLLQMSKLERYRDRIDKIETGVDRVLGTKDDQIEQLDEQIADFDEPQLRARKRQLEGFESELTEQRESITDRIDELEEEQDAAADTVREQTDLEEEVTDTRKTIEDRMEDFQKEVDEYQRLQNDLDEAEQEVQHAISQISEFLATGSGNLTIGDADANTIIEEVTAVVESIVTDTHDDGDPEPATRLGLSELNLESPPVAGAVEGFEGDVEFESDTDQPTDTILDESSAVVPPATPAVTGEPVDDETITVGSAAIMEVDDLDPIVSPEVHVDETAIRVPTPGLDVDPESVDIETVADAHDRIRERVSSIRDQLQALEGAVDEAESNADSLKQDAAQHERNAETARENASEVLTRITEIRQARARLAELREEFVADVEASAFEVDPSEQTPHKAFAERQQTLEHWITRLKAERDHHQSRATKLEERIEKANELLEEGNCPECGRPVEGAPNVAHREEWVENRDFHEEFGAALEEGIQELADRRERAKEFQERATALYGDEITVTIDADSADEPAKQLDPTTDLRPLHGEAAQAHLQAREERQMAATARIEALIEDLTAAVLERAAERTLAQLYRALARQFLRLQIEQAVDARIDAERDRDLIASQLDGQRGDVTAVQTRLQGAVTQYSELTDEFDPEALEEAKEAVEKIDTELDQLDEKLGELRNRKEAVHEDRVSLEKDLDQLEGLQERRARRQEEASAVGALKDQVTRVETMFVNLRADLRQQNVERLEALLQEMFATLYRNDAFADIELDADYDATLIEKGGGKLPPSKLSGGESAVFNIALRGAIYRLLTEGFEDDVPMPPLILDEPTAHLDDGHVDRLDDVVAAMRTAGVKQTIVVSHDEELIDRADQRIEVRQKQGTNRSVTEADRGVVWAGDGTGAET